MSDRDRERTQLLASLHSEHACVRRKAVYALAKHLPDERVLRALTRLEQTDDDREVRLAASLVIHIH